MTGKPTAEIQTPIDAHVKGFNTQDNDLFLSVFGDTRDHHRRYCALSLVEPQCSSQLARDVAKWREALGVTYEHLSYEMGFWNPRMR